MIIGISGKAGVGKTTLALVAEAKYDFTIVSFASLLKEELKVLLDTHGIMYRHENFHGTAVDKQALATIDTELFTIEPFKHIPTGLIIYSPISHTHHITYRALMQWYGAHKRQVNKDFWLQKFLDNTDFSQDIIVDDVRYRNEAALIKVLGGTLVRIEWSDKFSTDTHPSETELDKFPSFDCTIVKEHNVSLPYFHEICCSHLDLLTGALDDTYK
jgi:hypothetical protein